MRALRSVRVILVVFVLLRRTDFQSALKEKHRRKLHNGHQALFQLIKQDLTPRQAVQVIMIKSSVTVLECWSIVGT